ncbi:MAG: 3-deoxy-D-manno-octulosonic acid transferase [Planctomycetota bacterium]|jgi:3-deoxy-D-manno-octulosonic-acid transferase
MPDGPGPRLWYALYNVVLHVGALACLPVWLFVRIFRGRYRGQFLERMGILRPELLERFGQGPAVWMHAASAGETSSAVPLVRRLREAFPDHPFLFTVTSRYGKEMAQRQLEGIVDAVCFSPLDLPLFNARFLTRVRPQLYVMVETDLWPNLVRMAKARGARLALASGHAGPRSFPRSFWRAVLGCIDLLMMQTEYDRKNILGRGAPEDRVDVMGNLKFDSTGGRLERADIPAWRKELGLPEGAPVLVAGSTLADDEGPVLDAVAGLREEGQDLHAIVAPRRQERVPELERECGARGIGTARRTDGGSAPVLILDTMGELARAYNVADAAYVGGGLTADVGLHNLLEPLVCGAPVLFGPHHGKAERVAAELLRLGAGVEIRTGDELAGALRSVLVDAATRERLAGAGQRLLALNQGAAQRQADRIVELMAS